MGAVLLVAIACLSGCYSPPQTLNSHALQLIEPGKTTRAELDEWFGQPDTVGLDAEGRAMAGWTRAQYAGSVYWPKLEMQMLYVIITNGVVFSYTSTDQIGQPDPPRLEPAPVPKPNLQPKNAP